MFSKVFKKVFPIGQHHLDFLNNLPIKSFLSSYINERSSTLHVTTKSSLHNVIGMPKNKKSKRSKAKLQDDSTINNTPTTDTNTGNQLSTSQVELTRPKAVESPKKKKGSTKKKKKSTQSVNQLAQSFSKISVTSSTSQNSLKSCHRTSIVVPARSKSHSAGLNRTTGSKFETLEDIARYIRSNRAKNIIVMCGAGISTASGIPDFRTPGTGLYDNLKKYNIPTPTAVFDMEYFRMNPKPFFELAKELYPSGKYRPNLSHYFLRALHEKGLLLRLYTQNIDGLERIAGIPPSKLVEAHGTFSTASCTKCGKKYDGETVRKKIFKNQIPRCELTPLCWGVVKPDIVFFGEDLPKRFYYYLKDFPLCDLLIVMGTSLEVDPFAGLVDSVRFNVPRLLINRERVGPFKSRTRSRNTDAVMTSDIVRAIERFVTLLGWKRFVEETMASHEKLHEATSDPGADSGISCASSESSEAKDVLSTKSLPLINDGNIKRYFHTIRSTPLPKSKSSIVLGSRSETTASAIPKSLSYYDFIRDPSRERRKARNVVKAPPVPNESDKLVAFNKDRAPTIQYAQTVEGPRTKSSHARRTQSVPCTKCDSSDNASVSSTSGSSFD